MKTVDKKIAEQLWQKLAGQIRHGVDIIVHSSKGKNASDNLPHVIESVLRDVYFAGLDRGFDMGHQVFGSGDE